MSDGTCGTQMFLKAIGLKQVAVKFPLILPPWHLVRMANYIHVCLPLRRQIQDHIQDRCLSFLAFIFRDIVWKRYLFNGSSVCFLFWDVDGEGGSK